MSANTERRRSPRFSAEYHVRLSVQNSGTGAGGSLVADGVNISESGLLIRTSVPIPLLSDVSFNINEMQFDGWAVVRQCGGRDGDNYVGLEFSEGLRWIDPKPREARPRSTDATPVVAGPGARESERPPEPPELPTPLLHEPPMATPEVALSPAFEQVPERKNRIPILLAVMLVAAAVVFLGLPLLSPPVENGISLQVTDLGRQLVLGWNRNANALLRAQGGMLLITDGNEQPRVDLDQEDLRRGRLVYERQTGDVVFHLLLAQPGDDAISEIASFVGEPPLRADPAPAPDGLEERRELQIQMDQLRRQVEAETIRATKLRETIEALAGAVSKLPMLSEGLTVQEQASTANPGWPPPARWASREEDVRPERTSSLTGRTSGLPSVSQWVVLARPFPFSRSTLRLHPRSVPFPGSSADHGAGLR